MLEGKTPNHEEFVPKCCVRAKARLLVKYFLVSFWVATQTSIAWKDLVEQVDDFGQRPSDKYRGLKP